METSLELFKCGNGKPIWRSVFPWKLGTSNCQVWLGLQVDGAVRNQAPHEGPMSHPSHRLAKVFEGYAINLGSKLLDMVLFGAFHWLMAHKSKKKLLRFPNTFNLGQQN